MGVNESRYYYDLQRQHTSIRSLSPNELFNLPSTYTWNELKERYKTLALRLHPDKPDGNKDAFDYATQCFKHLAKELKMREANKNHFELKKQHQEEIQDLNIQRPTLNQENKPFIQKFNEVFEQNKYHDENIEFGYGSIMAQSSKNREDIEIKNIFKTDKVSNETFHTEFHKKVPITKQLMKYKEPEAVHMVKTIQFTELGEKINDYSGKTEKNNLQYTDYMKAYTEERVNTDLKRKEFKSAKDYAKYSNKYIKKPLTDDEQKILEKKKHDQERQEMERLQRLQQENKKIEDYYSRISQLMIK